MCAFLFSFALLGLGWLGNHTGRREKVRNLAEEGAKGPCAGDAGSEVPCPASGSDGLSSPLCRVLSRHISRREENIIKVILNREAKSSFFLFHGVTLREVDRGRLVRQPLQWTQGGWGSKGGEIGICGG